jgi:hypothetical protein
MVLRGALKKKYLRGLCDIVFPSHLHKLRLLMVCVCSLEVMGRKTRERKMRSNSIITIKTMPCLRCMNMVLLS